ncbi:MAG: hypothetical protein K6T73_01180 [Candidatus Bathyarchaeota archaeon]|nr:hypothetical protein [Candidatus Bathyarchaeota archaeon]
MEPILILVLVGALGGAIRSILGFSTQSDVGESFNWLKLIKSVVRAAVAGSFLVYSTVDVSSSVGIKMYIGAFFTSMGADVFLKEMYSSFIKTTGT